MTPGRDRGTARTRPSGPAAGGTREQGSATAELAAALPVFVLLLLVGFTGVHATLAKLRCVDAAREAARVAARGESGDAAARRVAPDGATISVRVEGDVVRAVVQVRVRPFGPRLPDFAVSGDAAAAVEPGGAS
jgi:Flp pilus assembly protein TadG